MHWQDREISLIEKVSKSKLEFLNIILMILLPIMLLYLMAFYANYERNDITGLKQPFAIGMFIISILQAAIHMYIIKNGKRDFIKITVIFSVIFLIISIFGFRYIYIEENKKAEEIANINLDDSDSIQTKLSKVINYIEKQKDEMPYRAEEILGERRIWYLPRRTKYRDNLQIIIICAYYFVYDIKNCINVVNRKNTEILDKI